ERKQYKKPQENGKVYAEAVFRKGKRYYKVEIYPSGCSVLSLAGCSSLSFAGCSSLSFAGCSSLSFASVGCSSLSFASVECSVCSLVFSCFLVSLQELNDPVATKAKRSIIKVKYL